MSLHEQRRSFGTRRSRCHGVIPLSLRSRVYCTLADRTSSLVYIELNAVVQLPFAFEIRLEGDAAVLRCETKSQRGSKVVAAVVSEHAGAGDALPTRVTRDLGGNTGLPAIDEVGSWIGFRKTHGFEV